MNADLRECQSALANGVEFLHPPCDATFAETSAAGGLVLRNLYAIWRYMHGTSEY